MTSHVHTMPVINMPQAAAVPMSKVNWPEISSLLRSAKTAEEYWTAVRQAAVAMHAATVSLQVAGRFFTNSEIDVQHEYNRSFTVALSEHDFVTFATQPERGADARADIEQLVHALRASIQAKLKRA
ncbi:MAG: hypothetical protein JOZ22_05965 [Acidobacteriia bacterium]|nr:hypothetical protein [Terriglobia bacterium]